MKTTSHGRPHTIEGYEEELDAADSMIDRLQGIQGDLVEALYEALTYFDERSDADCQGDPPRYIPNEEMRLQIQIKAAIEKAEARPSQPQPGGKRDDIAF
jgi:hypothetical protein